MSIQLKLEIIGPGRFTVSIGPQSASIQAIWRGDQGRDDGEGVTLESLSGALDAMQWEAIDRKHMREHAQRPEVKERQREYMREYNRRPEVKERQRKRKLAEAVGPVEKALRP